MKLWGGRFAKQTDKLTEDFNASIGFDSRMYQQDIQGSIAHAAMLARQGIISEQESHQIITGLEEIGQELEDGQLQFSVAAEDVHMNIETFLTAKIGELGKKLHTARSRNDQVSLDVRLYLRDEMAELRKLLLVLEDALLKLASQHLDTIMPGYTHLQKAQPITLAHHLMAYFEMLRRDLGRLDDCRQRLLSMPLGSGALAATGFPLDREFVRQQLGFIEITRNSLDGVSDRDFAIEFCSWASILMMHLSRFSEEIILWASEEFSFVTLDDGFSTGSSIMPQKKNPDVAELVRGKTGRVYGDLITLLTMMKSLPLAYNKDMQEDKEPVFDAIDTVELCVPVFTAMLDTLVLREKTMRKAASGGFINATDCADYLVKKGLPFRDAYGIVGRLVNMCIQTGENLETLTLKDFRAISGAFDEDVYKALELKTCVNGRKVFGGPAREAVEEQIARIKAFVKERECR